ncbi:linear amide C-N hydrolase [Pseudovibrio sp. Ad37]|uniref:linear amide C-N hydrolase n=1 Tax=Pseudovibrio sp. Ad37 TaxID=989422 RepID=UPI0007AEDBC1|nr:choloylglycine hydrolase family protein [Pseudovibrio sp. Ad37]KZL13640.1 Choloylglycine hydrolase [Pseudovibrio sp. Ad37]
MLKRFASKPIALFKISLALLGFVLQPIAANACTSFVLSTVDNIKMYGRTMEFGKQIPTKIGLIPRGYKFQSQINDEAGHSWTGKIAVIGASIFDSPALVDGMNEYGLSGGALYFPGSAAYKNPSDDKAQRTKEINQVDFLVWMLSTFKTVEEIKVNLDQVSLVGTFYESMDEIPPLHYTLHDAAGFSIVIEPINGELKVYDNPYTVLTNSPDFEWHVQNIRNYLFLSPFNIGSTEIMGQELTPFGQGSGLLGIPGDPTPPSRFIRALGLISTIDAAELNKNRLVTMEHVLNNFDIPKGFVRPAILPVEQEQEANDYTQWSTIADIENRKYFIKTYENPTLHGVSFEDFDASGSQIQYVNLPSPKPTQPLLPPMQ